jgi:hypothetical protein
VWGEIFFDNVYFILQEGIKTRVYSFEKGIGPFWRGAGESAVE